MINSLTNVLRIATSARVIAVGTVGILGYSVCKTLLNAYIGAQPRSVVDPVVGIDPMQQPAAVPAPPDVWGGLGEGRYAGVSGAPLPEANECRVAGRAVGAAIRREMGYPQYTVANRTVAAQRIEAHRKKDYPTMRVSHAETFASHAIHWVFTPTVVEEQTFARLHTVAEAAARALPGGQYDYSSSAVLRTLPSYLSSNMFVRALARKFNLVTKVGPGFQ